MANRTYNVGTYSLIKRLVVLYPTVKVTNGSGAVQLQKRTFTAAGASSVAASSSQAAAPTTGVGYAIGDGWGVRTVARTGAGAWTFTLSDPYQFLIGVELCGISNSGATNANAINGIAWDTTGNVTTNTAVGNGGTVKIVLFSGSTATDPASADFVTIRLTLGDATEP